MKRVEVAAAILALALSLAAVIALVGLPCLQMSESGSTSVSRESPGRVVIERQCHSLVEATGYRVLYVLLVPVFLASLYLLATLIRWKLAATLLIFLLGTFVLLTGFSIGLFFAPATLAGAVSLAFLLSSSSRTANDIPQSTA